MQKVLRKILRTVADHDPDYFDMHEDRNEALFARLYLERITQHAAAAGITAPATVLEAGCQAGRLVVPFAKLGFQVTGVDTSGYGLRRAHEHARAAGVCATFIHGDIVDVLRDQSEQRYDIVVSSEVVYLSERYQEILRALAKAVRPGGLLCVSHRSKFYYLLEAFRQYDMEAAVEVLRTKEGPFRGSRYYNWQTEQELRQLYQTLGMQWLAMYPIDRLAWLTGHHPSGLTSEQRERWLQLELGLSSETGTCGRYVLVIATPSAR